VFHRLRTIVAAIPLTSNRSRPVSRRFRPILAVVLALVALFPTPSAQAQPGGPDRLAEALESVGFTRSDLGCRPKTYWARFPALSAQHELLFHFEDLFAEPLRTYEFSRVMANALEHYLGAEYRSNNGNAMYKVAHYLGIANKVSGLRAYRAAAVDLPAHTETPLVFALSHCWVAAGDSIGTDSHDIIERTARSVPEPLHLPLATLVYRVADAWSWRAQAVEGLDPQDMQALFADQAAHQIEYSRPLVRASEAFDNTLMAFAGQKVVQAVDDAARDLRAVLDSTGLKTRDLSTYLSTPIGGIVVAGTGKHRHDRADGAVLVDLGGDDEYAGPVAASSLQAPVSAVVDLSGNDRYRADSTTVATQGAGRLGVGVLYDVEGDDQYDAADFAQGAGFFGFGLLWDEEGRDEYRLHFSGQGAGYFGIGLLVDAAGRDQYYLWGDGQGYGGPGGGVGVLADVSGGDRYVAEVDAHITGRGSGHSHNRVTSSLAQGVALGRRGDLEEGHSWAGGLGALIDLEGNDVYEAGNWALGTGYWFGTGILYDGGGNDRYRSCYYSMASGAHFAIGAIYDESGDDDYRMIDPDVVDDLAPEGRGMSAVGGAGLGFGWDYTMGLLVDKGGNDRYEGRIISGGEAMIRSTAILADLGNGDDTYILPADAGGGHSDPRDSYPAEVLPQEIGYGPYSHHGTSFGFLLDAGGTDEYFEFRADGRHRPSPIWQNGLTWEQPTRSSPEYGRGSHGIGMDVEGGTIPEVHVFEPRRGDDRSQR